MTEIEHELEAQIDGLKMAVRVLFNALPLDRGQYAERFSELEEVARRDNMMSGTIQILREFREMFEKP